MADGSHAFNFPIPQRSMLRPGEIVVDLFAGGGGASEALKQALGVDPALAYNHDEWAIGMHAANHPLTDHHREDIWHADPRVDVAGRPVGWFHFSPDCTHFSQAKGGQPRSRKIRSLAWVGAKWIGQLGKVGLAPRIVSMENVWQMLSWCPLVAKRDKATGRVLKMDGTVAAPGERVPVEQQQLVPDKKRLGQTWDRFVEVLRGFGYAVEWRKLTASDYGAGTSRERLFLLARRDGEPIRWPEPTHGPGRAHPVVPAAASIDFSDLGVSIFERPRPLADATMRRIARGVVKHVLQAKQPFIVGAANGAARNPSDVPQPVGSGRMARRNPACREDMRSSGPHDRGEQAAALQGAVRGSARPVRAGNSADSAAHAVPSAPLITEFANAGNGGRTWSAQEPLRTQCAGVKGGHFAMVAPVLVPNNTNNAPKSARDPLPTATTCQGRNLLVTPALVKFKGDSIGHAITEPVPTITAGGACKRPAGAAHSLGIMSAFLEQACGGYYTGAGNDLRDPAPTICAQGSIQRLVTAHMATLRNNMTGAEAREPLATIAAGGEHHALVACTLSPEQEAGALRVAAFLINYYGNGTALGLREPLDTVTTRDRMALVTVYVHGEPYVIVDIKLRMLKPAELFRAQGFPPQYVIDRTADGRRISNTRAVRMVGNSVSPPPLRALAEANLDAAQPARLAA